MKKSLLVLGAIAALAFVGCKHGTTTVTSDPNVGGGNGGSETPTVTVVTVTATSGYAGPSWTPASDWKTFKIEFSEAPSNMQMVYTGDVVKSHESWGDSYYENYSGAITDTSVTADLAETLTALQVLSSDITKVSSIGLNDMGKADGVAKIKSVSVEKTDGTTQTLEVPDPTWGYTKE